MSPPRLLLVDDEPLVLRTARRVVGSLFEVDTAADGEEALVLLGRQTYDVLVTDYRMPGIHGVELLERARAAQPGLAGVLVTGSAEHAASLDVRRFHTLIKPYDGPSLIAVIERALMHGARLAEHSQFRSHTPHDRSRVTGAARKVS